MSAVESGSVTRLRETDIFYPEIMPEDWKDQFKGLVVIRDKNGHEKLYGIDKDDDKKTELPWKPLEDAIERVYGITPQSWTIEEYGDKPELANAVIENTLLKAQINKQDRLLVEKDDQMYRLRQDVERYQQQIRGLTDSNVELSERVSALERLAGVVQPTPTDPPQIVEPNTTNHWDNPPDNLHGTRNAPPVVNGETVTTPPLDQSPPVLVNERDNVVITDERNNIEEREPSRWNRMRERLGGAVLGWQVRAHNGAYRIMDRNGRVIDEVDDTTVVEEYRESERRAGGRVLMIGAVAVGAVLLAWWLAKHTGHSHDEIINNGGITEDQINSLTNKINNNTNDAINDAKNALSAQESKDHAQEMSMLNHLNRHLHNLRGVNVDGVNVANFHTSSFYGRTPHQAVSNMFDVIRDNNIRVHGLTTARIDRITDSMMRNHWHIASGMKVGNEQNIVDVARDWADGRTQNWQASGLQGLRREDGTSAENWERFMRLASRHGVTFSRA